MPVFNPNNMTGIKPHNSCYYTHPAGDEPEAWETKIYHKILR